MSIQTNFGYRAHQAYMQQLQRDPAEALTQTIRYSPKTSLNEQIADAFGYATADVALIDSDGDGKASQGDLTAALGEASAANYLKAVDLDGDGQVGVQEQAAYVLFQDNAPGLLAGTLEASVAGGLVDDAASQQALSQVAAQLRDVPSQNDGQITAEERTVADSAGIGQLPNFTRLTLEELTKTLNLQGRRG